MKKLKDIFKKKVLHYIILFAYKSKTVLSCQIVVNVSLKKLLSVSYLSIWKETWMHLKLIGT